jgi:nitrilase
LYDREGILYVKLDLGAIPRSKFDFDVVGHYARPDVFQLRVNKTPNLSVTTDDKK